MRTEPLAWPWLWDLNLIKILSSFKYFSHSSIQAIKQNLRSPQCFQCPDQLPLEYLNIKKGKYMCHPGLCCKVIIIIAVLFYMIYYHINYYLCCILINPDFSITFSTSTCHCTVWNVGYIILNTPSKLLLVRTPKQNLFCHCKISLFNGKHLLLLRFSSHNQSPNAVL